MVLAGLLLIARTLWLALFESDSPDSASLSHFCLNSGKSNSIDLDGLPPFLEGSFNIQ